MKTCTDRMATTMSDVDTCPNGCDLRGNPIPEEHAGLYGEDVTHFSRAFGRYDMALDRTVEWSCPDCGICWPR
jgi:hypothetical protein